MQRTSSEPDAPQNGYRGWCLYLTDWGELTIGGFYTGYDEHPIDKARDNPIIFSMEDAIAHAAALRIMGRNPIEVWHNGECVKVLKETTSRGGWD